MTTIRPSSNLEKLLKDLLSQTMKVSFPLLPTPEPLITLGKVSEFQCNNAMGLSKLLSQLKPPQLFSPQEVGVVLKNNLIKNNIIEEFEPTGKGFINITIKRDWLEEMVRVVLVRGIQPPEINNNNNNNKESVLIDFSSPNIAKEMHVGHLRSTIIGEALSRLMEFCQFNVKRINHVGDWGTAFGMLILFLKKNYPNYLQEPPAISDLTSFYREAKACFDNDAVFKENARLEVVKLQALESESIKAWELICHISRNEFNKIYSRLGVRIDERGESFYNPMIPEVLALLEKKGLVQESDGAKLVVSTEQKLLEKLDAKDMTKLAGKYLIANTKEGATLHPNLIALIKKANLLSGAEGEEIITLSKKEKKPWKEFNCRTDLDKLMVQLSPFYQKKIDPLFLDVFQAHGIIQEEHITVPRFTFPLMVVKSDGGYTYDTTDITAMYHRFVVEKMNRVIYCTDAGQFEHFRMCAQLAQDMGWMDNHTATWSHAGFGLVTGSDGKKIKTRSGETAKLKDLLDEACEGSLAILKEREAGDRAQGHSEEDIQKLSEIIGIGAVKYFDLKQNRTTDYAFSYEKMLDMSGNTAVFLLYQYARMCSIKRKAGISDEELRKVSSISMETPHEKKLALCAFRFESIILRTVEDLLPHHLTDFAYELMSCFSDFFQNCRVIDDPLQNSRLCLVELTRITLKQTLDILNIEVAERI